MQTATAAFGTTVTSNDIVTAFRVLITFPSGVTYSDASLTVSDVTVDRSLVTDMPAGTRLVAGYPSAQMTLTLAGTLDPTDETKSIAWLMGHYQTTSPLYRRDCKNIVITLDAGVLDSAAGTTPPFEGVEFLRNFTGYIDDYTVDQQAGTVAITALDGRSLFSTVPMLPLGAFSSDTVAASFKPNGLGPLLTSAWVMNYLCESIGRYSSPPPRSQAVFRQTNHGGAWPELGWTAAHLAGSSNLPLDPAHSGATWVPGVFGKQVPTNGFSQYYNVPPVGNANGIIAGDIGSSGNQWYTECWIQPITSPYAPPGNAFLMTLQGAPSSVRLDLAAAPTVLGGALIPSASVITGAGPTISTVNPASLTIPNDGAWHYLSIQFHFTSTTNYTATFTVDGSSQAASGTHGAAVAANCPIVLAAPQFGMPCESIQVTNETAPASNFGFTPSALVDIDASLNQLTVVPDIAGQDAWSAIQQMADAEQGVAGLNELGAFQFRNRNTLAKSASVRAISADQSLATMQVETSMSGYTNHVTVPYTGLTVGPLAWVWSPSDVPLIPANGIWTQTVTTDNPVVALATTDSGICPANQAPDGRTYWRACLAPDGAGAEVHFGITVTCAQMSSTTIKVTVTSTRTVPVYLVTPIGVGYPATSQGQPALFLGGRFVTTDAQAGDTTTTTAPSSAVADAQWPPLIPDGGATTNPLGEHLLAISDNPWRQDAGSAQQMASDLLSDLCSRRPLWTNVKIMHDPRLQLGDRVTLTDPNVTGMASEDAFIYSYSIGSDWTGTLDLRPIGAPGGWLLNQAGRSEINGTIYI